jgi:CO/xanthine dehydrogenase FAD-binding subunit
LSSLSYATLRAFEYFEPTSLDEALSLMAKYGDQAKILAGGTDLTVLMMRRKLNPNFVINISKIKDLDLIDWSEDTGLKTGALCTLRSLERSKDVRKNYPLLFNAIKLIGSVQIRNMATIGGNLCNASPAADTAPPLLALDAQVKVVGKHGPRTIPLDGFFLGPGRTALKQGEILTEVDVKGLPPQTGTAFAKMGRTPTDISKVSVAVVMTARRNKCQDVRIALGAVAATPFRAKGAEQTLLGKEISDDTLEAAALVAADEAKPITDVRSTARWRKGAIKYLVKTLLQDTMKEVSK